MNIFGLGIGWEQLLIILLVGSLLVGPEKLPSYARKTAKFLRRIRKITSSVTSELSKSIGLDDEDSGVSNVKKDISDIRKSLEKDIVDLKNTFTEQSKSISQSIEDSTKGTLDTLKQNAKDISDTFNNQADVQTESISANSDNTTDTGFNDTFEATDNTSTEFPSETIAHTTIESHTEKPLSAPIIHAKDPTVTTQEAKESLSS